MSTWVVCVTLRQGLCELSADALASNRANQPCGLVEGAACAFVKPRKQVSRRGRLSQPLGILVLASGLLGHRGNRRGSCCDELVFIGP